MADKKKRYAQVGLGGRSRMYTKAVCETYKDIAEMVAFCDVNQGRMNYANENIQAKGAKAVATYKAEDFDRMIAEAKPDVVIVTSKDSTHWRYICRAMELGCDVMTEKPMTVDEQSCRRILDTAAKTGRKITVTFNYRYSPPRTQVKEIIADGAIGEVLSVDFAWLLDTRHGADYFRRWHRRRENSGSLLVHKATHHFDLVNWWIGDAPEEVFAFGSRKFYTPRMAEELGLAGRAERCKECKVADRCKFHLDLAASEHLRRLYLDCEAEDGYFRDRCVFSGEIDIWDNEAVCVRYRRGALMSYQLHNFSPYEGYRVAFNGAKGRLEHACCEATYTSGDGTVPGELIQGKTTITLVPAFSQPKDIPIRPAAGGHGGGDPLLLDDLFLPEGKKRKDAYGHRATQRDGAYSILVGVAAYHSIDEHRPVRIPELIGEAAI